MIKVETRTFNALKRIFDIGNYRLGHEKGKKIWTCRIKIEICAEEAYDPWNGAAYCAMKCIYREMCDEIMEKLGDIVAWYGDYAAFCDEEYEKARFALQSASNIVEKSLEPLPRKQWKKWRGL